MGFSLFYLFVWSMLVVMSAHALEVFGMMSDSLPFRFLNAREHTLKLIPQVVSFLPSDPQMIN